MEISEQFREEHLRRGRPGRLRYPPRASSDRCAVGIAVAVVVGALLAAWTEWQPQRSVDASEQALVLLPHNPVAARAAAQAGVDRDPLSAQALFTFLPWSTPPARARLRARPCRRRFGCSPPTRRRG